MPWLDNDRGYSASARQCRGKQHCFNAITLLVGSLGVRVPELYCSALMRGLYSTTVFGKEITNRQHSWIRHKWFVDRIGLKLTVRRQYWVRDILAVHGVGIMIYGP